LKLENWPVALNDFIDARRDTAFVWGTTDCCLFAADAVEAMTGTDYVADYRGTYTDAKGALRLINDAGGLSAFVPKSFEEVEPGYAQRGDVVLLEIDDRNSLGIHLGAVIAGQGEAGIVFVPTALAQRAWRTA
jgi:hypothetical protein